jgi:hypothetical protein
LSSHLLLIVQGSLPLARGWAVVVSVLGSSPETVRVGRGGK